MAIKLYKRESGLLRYWEAWEDENVVIVHWGVVGKRGRTRELRLAATESASSVVEREAAPMRGQGYLEFDDDKLEQVVIQYPVVEMGTTADLDKRIEVEGLMNERLGWTGLGHCDGGDIGSGTMNVFCLVVDAYKATYCISEELRAHDLLAGVRILLVSEDGERLLFPVESLKNLQ